MLESNSEMERLNLIKELLIYTQLHGTHWVLYIHEFFFDSYGFTLPNKLTKFIKKQNEFCLFSEN